MLFAVKLMVSLRAFSKHADVMCRVTNEDMFIQCLLITSLNMTVSVCDPLTSVWQGEDGEIGLDGVDGEQVISLTFTVS